MKIAITAESTIDLPQELLQKYDITTIPFQVLLGENEYKDGEITSADIFEYVSKTKILPKTSAINEHQYSEFFTEQLKDHDALVHFALSSKISSACSHAIEAAKHFENVYVVDSLSLSTGIALEAIKARKLAEAGADAKQIYEELTALTPKVQASFVIERLDYLYKGGRCSALALFGANLLKLRPQIILKDGAMKPAKKYRGHMHKVIEAYCKDTLEEHSNPDLSVGFITYTSATPEMIETARKALNEKGFENIYETHAGATITSHCGEHTLGILFIDN
ncbi:MAG: DegV family protein [Clostridia bacterium]|nr:DegV family protein [Clostridia bacterium]